MSSKSKRLLERVQEVLSGDATLGNMLQGVNRVGTAMRLLPHKRCIEIGYISVSDQDRLRQKSAARLRVSVFSDQGDILHDMADRVSDLLTPTSLTLRTPEHARLIVSSVRKQTHTTLPVDDHGHQAELTFNILYLNH